MQYGIRYTILGSEVVSPISSREMAVTVAKSWRTQIHPDATPVTRMSESEPWMVIKDSSITFNHLPTKEG